MAQSAPSAALTKAWYPGAPNFPTLFERYQVLGIIGQGGMGTVFKGYHLNLKRFVAIKTLRVDHLSNTDLVKRFMREVELVGQMDHANVVRATDAGEKNGVFYLVMEFLTGADLARLVGDRGPLDVADSCELTRQAALGLDYIHRTLVHRDIKPSNLMLTTSGLVKVLDLGLARCDFALPGDAEQTPEGVAVGTYSYMAPEQAMAGAAVDGRADIYGLGCTLVKLLTGRAPFGSPEFDNPVKQTFAHCNVPLTAAPAFALIPEVLRPILLRMTAKKPNERYGSGREVAEALAPFAVGSQPLALLEKVADVVEVPLRALSEPLPDVLSRLTYSPVDTSRSDPTAPATPLVQENVAMSLSASPPELRKAPPGRPAAGNQAGKWSPARLGAVLAVVAFLAAGAVVAVLYWPPAPAPQVAEGDPSPKQPPPAVTPPVRLLDALPAFKHLLLLDQMPLPVGSDSEDISRWRWDKGLETLEAKGHDFLFFPLGTTPRNHFKFEAGITQNPPAGNVGIFWGYHEDEDKKKEKTPGVAFAWFQTLCLERVPSANGGYFDQVGRGRGQLGYNKNLELVPLFRETLKSQIVQLRPGETILRVEIFGNRLDRAELGGVPLTQLCDAQANKLFQFHTDHYRGAVGVFSLRNYAATFSNVRFYAYSSN
jgi:serine/threonine protein kinase